MTSTPADLAAHVAAEIRAEMARQRRTGVDLGKHLKMSQPTISKRLTGEVPFDLKELASVADYLGVTVSSLMPRSIEVPA